MSAPMVKALLDGRKTQTRRIFTPDRIIIRPNEFHPGELWYKIFQKREGVIELAGCGPFIPDDWLHYCPFGQVGDRLWVRETWHTAKSLDTWSPKQIGEKCLDANYRKPWAPIQYAVDQHRVNWDDTDWGLLGKTRVSIHMPRWASRITLEITDIRVQRLQTISEEDAVAEGIDRETAASILQQAAGKLEPDEAYWVEDDQGLERNDGYLCLACAEKLAKKHKRDYVTGGGCPESDGPAYCEDCLRPLYISLTEYGIDRELFLEGDEVADPKYFTSSGLDAAIGAMIAGGIGAFDEAQHGGRLAQIGFATLWDSINAKRAPWSANPFVWALTFKRVQP
jgi:hypothetical protein